MEWLESTKIRFTILVVGIIPVFCVKDQNITQRVEWLSEPTPLEEISAGVEGGPEISLGRRQAFRQFFIRGASCRFASVFCKLGIGW